MTTSRDDQVAWINAVRAHLGVSLTELARRAKIAPSTLQRPVNDPNYVGMISGRTMAAVAAVAGLNVMEFPARMRGLAENDAAPFQYDDRNDAADNINRAVRELVKGRNGRDPWLMRSYALELAGILPGDIMIVDLNRQARPRDIVCAQIYDWSGMKSETVFRIYEPPYLVTHSMRAGIDKPIAVDNSSVLIKGVVDAVLRGTRFDA
jgi:hypothetical protein